MYPTCIFAVITVHVSIVRVNNDVSQWRVWNEKMKCFMTKNSIQVKYCVAPVLEIFLYLAQLKDSILKA